MTIVSVASDTHLEFAPLELPGGDILLLCGDTLVAKHLQEGEFSTERRERYEEFCTKQLSKYSKVLAIGGNHEPYGARCIEDVPGLYHALFAEFAPHAQFLDNQHVEIEGVRFIGSTLWASCGYGTPRHLAIQNGLNDFALIKTTYPHEKLTFYEGCRRFLVEDAYRLHQEAKAFLEEAVKTDLPCVIMTHHAPSYLAKNAKRYPGQELDEAYFSNLHPFIEANPNVRFFFSGHSHYRWRHKVGETKLAANPRGYYPQERMSHGFDPRECDFSLQTMEFIS